MNQPTVRIKFVAAFKELFNKKWRFIIFYGGRSGGKSRATAEALLLRGRQGKLRILCTRQIQNTIRDSVHKLLSDLINEYGFTDYEVTEKSIVNKLTGTEFIFKGLLRNITEIKSLEGVDICWVEEAQAVSDESWDILIPTIRKPGSQIIITFNRQAELDPVYKRFVMDERKNSYVAKVNYDVLERAGLLSDETKQEIEADKAYPSLFAHKWLGEPIPQGATAIIGRDATLLAMQRVIEPVGQVIVGVDVARMGDDKTVFHMRHGLKTIRREAHQHLRTTEVCDALERFSGFGTYKVDDKEFKVTYHIDDTGVGGGVTDEMIRRSYPVVAINFGGEPKDKDKYPNLISEAWFEFADLVNIPDPTGEEIDPSLAPKPIQLEMDSDLLMELTNRNWKHDTSGRRKVESKDDYKKRGFKSPDNADACIICYYTPKVAQTRVYSDKPSIF